MLSRIYSEKSDIQLLCYLLVTRCQGSHYKYCIIKAASKILGAAFATKLCIMLCALIKGFSTSIDAASLDYTQQQLVQIEPNELNFEPQDTDNATCFNAI